VKRRRFLGLFFWARGKRLEIHHQELVTETYEFPAVKWIVFDLEG
jgi:hypothetical protein